MKVRPSSTVCRGRGRDGCTAGRDQEDKRAAASGTCGFRFKMDVDVARRRTSSSRRDGKGICCRTDCFPVGRGHGWLLGDAPRGRPLRPGATITRILWALALARDHMADDPPTRTGRRSIAISSTRSSSRRDSPHPWKRLRLFGRLAFTGATGKHGAGVSRDAHLPHFFNGRQDAGQVFDDGCGTRIGLFS